MKVTQIPRKSNKKRMNTGARRLLITAILLVLIVVVCVLIAVFYPLSREIQEKQQNPVSSDEVANNAVVIRSIGVEGNRHLSGETVILASGLKVGQNFMTVSKNAAEANILANCPYVKSVKISSPTYDSYVITIEEKTAIGAMYADGRWVVLGEDYTSLGYLTISGDRPDRYLYVKGVQPSGNALGKAAMTERYRTTLHAILTELSANDITGISCIDLSDLTNITLDWNHQIRVTLGTETNLAEKIKVLNATLPLVLKNHGQQAEGTMDLSSYSDNSGTNQMLFTPDGLLQVSSTAASETSKTGSETGTSATGSSAE